MKLSCTDADSLSALGIEARAMLMRGDYGGLANRFGYALAFGRDPAHAIESDYLRASESPWSTNESQHIRVSYFEPNSTGLFALVACDVSVGTGKTVLLELIVTGRDERHVTIEEISGAIE